MVTTLRIAVDRMKAWGVFGRAMSRLHDGIPQADVLAILGPPDRVGGREPEVGIEFRWEYHDRLPDHVDLIVAFAGGAVRTCFTRHLPQPKHRPPFRKPGLKNPA